MPKTHIVNLQQIKNIQVFKTVRFRTVFVRFRYNEWISDIAVEYGDGGLFLVLAGPVCAHGYFYV